ncbi:MAG: NUDIX hydrolase [Thermodesulfovibrionales bacterium]
MKVVNRKTLWKGHYLRSVLVEYIDERDHDPSPDPGFDKVQKIRDWETIERVGCSGVVVIVPFMDDGTVILIRQYRPPVDGYVIELPAGLIDIGETPEASARRELIEETGYEATDMDFLISGPAASGSSSEILDVFVASGLSFIGIGKRDEAENMETIRVPMEALDSEISRLEQEGNYIDLKIHGMIRLAKDFLRKKSARDL